MKKLLSMMIVATMLLSLCITAVSASTGSTVTINVYSEVYTGTPAPATGTFKAESYDVYKVSYTVSGVDSSEDKITSLGIKFNIDDSTKIAAKSWKASVANPPALKDANGFVSVVGKVTPGTGAYAWADADGIDAYDWSTYPSGGTEETLPYAETLIYVTKDASVTFTYDTYKPDGGQAASQIVIDSWTGGNERVFNNDSLQYKVNGKAGNVLVLGAPSTTAVTGVTMAPKALNLKVGETGTVTGTVAPSDATDKTVTYSSSNTSVATVDASTGLVTAVAKGTATITVTTTDGGKTDTCAVTVAPADVVPAAADSKVVGNATTGLKDADGKSVTIDASRSYGAAKFDNVQIDAGDYIYKVVAKDSNGNEKEFDVASEYLEVSGKASFIAIVRSATHTITSVVLKAFKKGE